MAESRERGKERDRERVKEKDREGERGEVAGKKKKETRVRKPARRKDTTSRYEAPSTSCCSRAWLGLACGGKALARPPLFFIGA